MNAGNNLNPCEWNSDRSKMKKGITLSKNEASALFFLLSDLDNTDVIDKLAHPDSVTLSEESENFDFA